MFTDMNGSLLSVRCIYFIQICARSLKAYGYERNIAETRNFLPSEIVVGSYAMY